MRVENLVPEVYYKESRDFSYIGRVLEVAFNYLKTNVDLVGKSVNVDSSSNLINLLVSSLGFESKHEYTNEDLVKLCSSFVYLVRNKGSIRAIEDTINILLRSQNISYDMDLYYEEDDKHSIIVEIPQDLEDTVLLDDVFDYILPAGIIYRYIRVAKDKPQIASSIGVGESVEIIKANNFQLGQISGNDNSDDNVYTNRSMTYTSTTAEQEEVDDNE